MYVIDKSSIATVESRNKTFSLNTQRYSRTDCFQLPSKRIIDKHNSNNIAITKQNTIRRTITKLGWAKACPEKEIFML